METGITRNKLLARIDHLEDDNRYIQESLEMALSLGDFQEKLNESHNTLTILNEAEYRIRRLLTLDACALYFEDGNNSDIRLSLCEPKELIKYVEDEIHFMTDQGLFAWAMHERRGIFIKSKDHSREFLLHVISTYSQKKGMFVGLLPKDNRKIPNASISLLSVILLNTANAIESIESYNYIRKQNTILEEKVEKRTNELIRYERRLQRVHKMESIGTLAGGVAHDLNNILSGLVSYPELLLMDLPKGSPLRKPIQTIQRSGEKAADIVQDLLTLARRGVGDKTVVKLNQIVSEYLQSPEFNKLQRYHPNVQIETNLINNLLNIFASPVHISKCIMNLVANAAESMPEGGLISISTYNKYIDTTTNCYDDIEEGDYIIFSITDNGTGIPPLELERIFEPFYSKKVLGESGTGLGMAVVWGTVKDHNGYIDVKSVEGKGTTFTIYLPVTREIHNKKESLVTIKDYKGKGESILVVDDIKEQRDIATNMLTKLGYSVTAVSSGMKAVEYLKENNADLLVLDMIMEPGIDGLETYKQVLELNPKQKSIIASGFSETVNVKEAKRLGAGAYLRKPYLLENIGMAVKCELDKSQSPV